IPEDALHFEQAGSGHGSDIQIQVDAGGQPLFKMEAKNSPNPELGSTAFKYNTSEDVYEVAGEAAKSENESKKKMWNDVLAISTQSLQPLNQSNRKNIVDNINAVINKNLTEDQVFKKESDSIVGPADHADKKTQDIIKDEFEKVVFNNQKNIMGIVDPDIIGNYYSSKGDDFIQIATKGLYSLKDGWQATAAPSFKDSLNIKPNSLRMRLRPSNSTFRAAFSASGNWVHKSDVDLKSPSRIEKSYLNSASVDNDAYVLAGIIAGALGYSVEDIEDAIEFSTSSTPELIDRYGEETPTSWPPTPERDMDEDRYEYYPESLKKLYQSLLKENSKSLLKEELTRADKKEIKNIARKEAIKEIERVVGNDFSKTIQEEIKKSLGQKATKQEVAEISKQVLKKLYKEMSQSYNPLIDRIKI
ncbi:hypothetical protein CL634_11655, partial [bacterium]|nr:hypothetical protein [bacterium]